MPRENSQDWNDGEHVTGTRAQDINEDLDDLYELGSDRLRIVRAASGLAAKIDIGPGAYRVGDTHGTYAGGTDIAMTLSQTNYVMIDAAGAIQLSTAGWTPAYARLGTVVCNGSDITSISLWKTDAVGGLIGGSQTVNVETLAGTETMTTASDKFQFLDPGGSDRDVELPTAGVSEGDNFYIMNTGDNGEILSVKESGTLVKYLHNGESCLFIYDGTGWTTMLSEENKLFIPAKEMMQLTTGGSAAFALSEFSTISPDSTSFGSGVGTTRTVSHTIGSGNNRLLLVGVHYANATSISTSCTFNGVAMTKAVTINNSPSGETEEMWYLINPPVGTYDIVLTISSSKNIQVLGSSYFGCLQSGQVDASNTGNTGTTSIAPTVTVATNMSWIMCFAKNNGATYTAGAGTVERRAGSASSFFDSSGGRATGSQGLAATCASASHGWVIVSVKPIGSMYVGSMDFDAAAEEAVTFQWTVPDGYNGSTLTARFHWLASAPLPSSGDVIWGIQAASFADGDLFPGSSGIGTAQEVTDSVAGVGKIMKTAATGALTPAGTLKPGDIIVFKVYRKAAAGGDTMTGDAKLLGVEILF